MYSTLPIQRNNVSVKRGYKARHTNATKRNVDKNI